LRPPGGKLTLSEKAKKGKGRQERPPTGHPRTAANSKEKTGKTEGKYPAGFRGATERGRDDLWGDFAGTTPENVERIQDETLRVASFDGKKQEYEVVKS